MAMTSGELAAVLDELRARTVGWRVKKVYQPSPHELVFSFNNGRLLISVHPRFGRMGLIQESGEMPEKPTPFAGLLRKHLSGCAIEGFDKEPGERLVRIRFSGHSLYCRFYAPCGYLLTDAAGMVVAVNDLKSPLKLGMEFHLPPGRGSAEESARYEGSPSEATEREYEEKIRVSGFEEEKKSLLSAARAERKRLARLMAALQGDRENLARYEECKRWGDLCRIYYAELKRGLHEISLEDPATGEPVKITLSPELGPAENLELLYKKYRKFKTGMEHITAAITSAAEKAEREAAKVAALEKAGSAEDLVPFRSPRPATAAREKQKRSAFRSFVSADGFEMLVGRSGRENDELVRKSNGNDLWFHVRDFPGSHVVVRTGKKTDVPSGTIAEAARLALKHSSRARDGKGTVVYTFIKHVKKPKNAPPGSVLVTREKTVQVHLGRDAKERENR
ncbi:MAG: NFACT family protein [Nitrospinae bacterium]|nr:NFACT family protein [Nitrospinota bacterium]